MPMTAVQQVEASPTQLKQRWIESMEQRCPGHRSVHHYLNVALRAVDTDGDGRVTLPEFRVVVERTGGALNRRECERVFCAIGGRRDAPLQISSVRAGLAAEGAVGPPTQRPLGCVHTCLLPVVSVRRTAILPCPHPLRNDESPDDINRPPVQLRVPAPNGGVNRTSHPGGPFSGGVRSQNRARLQ